MRKHLLFITLIALLFNCKPDAVSPNAIAYNSGRLKAFNDKPIKFETIVILGSSTASGVGASQYKYSWAGLLRGNFFKGQVVNLAKGGYTTYHILPNNASHPGGRPSSDTLRNITAALARKPTTLIISMTTNDVASGVSIDEIMSNLNLIRAKAIAAGVRQVIITTSHPRKINASATAKYIQQRDRIMQTYGESAVNFFDPVADSEKCFKAELLSGDNLHPNDKGHEILFEQIRKALKL
ncbi:SGNH/GDSL hydrolase family protein [Spirosoma taeanense]|uniref:SGNH/GDSL hydrolase family protein n=1 Tax=Spirosoma taeanense TaxID=2735870 RepID=A0A6M5YFY8_9BACT|nr:SGNH/GDSL hydrolase family protein [Spirosoma taeanense]QJW91892.1 SGNH/GDSL hydrolase family protein [Spirosoma taeanense]